MRRYIIYADRDATWVLVSSSGICRWHVERFVHGDSRERISLEGFEASAVGRRLGPMLDAALMDAQHDAS